MRLTAHQTQAIRQLAQQVGRAQTRVRVFGSRLDDSARGGDVDLMHEQPAPVDNPARMAATMTARVSRAMRGRKVDVLMIEPVRFIRDSVLAEPVEAQPFDGAQAERDSWLIRADSITSNGSRQPSERHSPANNANRDTRSLNSQLAAKS
jgi:predicted nucleotidyltransferase